MKILICGTRSPLALEIAKNIKNSNQGFNHQIIGADCFFSNVLMGAIDGFETYPSPALNYDEFAKKAKQIVQNLRPDLIIPLNEEVFYWAKLRKSFEMPLFAPDLSILMRLHSKLDFIEIVQNLGFNAPKTWQMQGNENPKNLVFKPQFSRFGEMVQIKPKKLPIQNPQNPYIAQEYVKGRDYSFYALAFDGCIHGFACYYSNWRTMGGASYYFSPQFGKTREQALNIATKIAKKLELTGQFSCDFRLDENGAINLLECNPRATSGLHLLEGDFLAACFGAANLSQSETPKYIGLAYWFLGAPFALKKLKLSEYFQGAKIGQDVFKGKRLLAVMDMLNHIFKSLQNNVSITQYLTRDIECNNNLDQDK
jgi:ATP-grasp domain